LGFAVGEEPLASLFASRGCEILATDLAPDTADPLSARWLTSGQHLAGYGLLNKRGVATADDMARVRMRYVDMRHIPADLTGFDFLWSSCSLEHLGTIELGMKFVEDSVQCLRPGGVAVHTTEFNVMSNERTIQAGPDVLFRRRDIEQIVRRVKRLGCTVEPRDYSPGDAPNDRYIALPPYPGRPHLKLDYAGYTITSMGFILTKKG
jgi:SAM-dependent methyltransferase